MSYNGLFGAVTNISTNSEPDQAAAKARTSFFSLPAELRNRIYEAHFEITTTHTTHVSLNAILESTKFGKTKVPKIFAYLRLRKRHGRFGRRLLPCTTATECSSGPLIFGGCHLIAKAHL